METVQIFLADPERQDERDLAQAWASLDDEERARADGLRSARDRQTYVVAHGLLRCILARQLGVAKPAAIRFSRTALGRPELASGRDPRFNLSHTQGLVGCAVTETRDVGLDLEEARTPTPLEVAHRYFSRDELAHLQALPPAQQHDRFYTLWTLKESYIKGCGRGLALPLDSFTVEPQAQGATRLVLHDPDQDAGAWTLRWWRFDRHFAALAVRATAAELGISVATGQRIAVLAGR